MAIVVVPVVWDVHLGLLDSDLELEEEEEEEQQEKHAEEIWVALGHFTTMTMQMSIVKTKVFDQQPLGHQMRKCPMTCPWSHFCVFRQIVYSVHVTRVQCMVARQRVFKPGSMQLQTCILCLAG